MQLNAESGQVSGSSELQVPAEVQRVLEVLNQVWMLLAECQLHPEVSSQFIGYLFFFVNASLFNSLMERGTSVPTPSVASLCMSCLLAVDRALRSLCSYAAAAMQKYKSGSGLKKLLMSTYWLLYAKITFLNSC